jgi:hypothetical protein
MIAWREDVPFFGRIPAEQSILCVRLSFCVPPSPTAPQQQQATHHRTGYTGPDRSVTVTALRNCARRFLRLRFEQVANVRPCRRRQTPPARGHPLSLCYDPEKECWVSACLSAARCSVPLAEVGILSARRDRDREKEDRKRGAKPTESSTASPSRRSASRPAHRDARDPEFDRSLPRPQPKGTLFDPDNDGDSRQQPRQPRQPRRRQNTGPGSPPKPSKTDDRQLFDHRRDDPMRFKAGSTTSASTSDVRSIGSFASASASSATSTDRHAAPNQQEEQAERPPAIFEQLRRAYKLIVDLEGKRVLEADADKRTFADDQARGNEPAPVRDTRDDEFWVRLISRHRE